MLLSACLIVKNESKRLPRCLHSLQNLADEILILDTGSQDGSPDLATRWGAQVWSCEWQEHFAQTRNKILARAQGEWILSIDADEWLPSDCQVALRAFLAQASPAIYALPWRQHPTQALSQKAVLFPNRRGVVYLGRVHELPWDPTGELPIRRLEGLELRHEPFISPLDPAKVAAARQLLVRDLQHPDPVERFHALRHWAQSELILKHDAAAHSSFEAAWQMFQTLPEACHLWGASVLEGLLFLALQAADRVAWRHWRQLYALHYPHNSRLALWPEQI